MLTLKNLTVFTINKKILHNINFSFKKGKIYALMGPNGSGKTTLAYAIMGHPAYQLGKESIIKFNGKILNGLSVEKRAKAGIFLSFQASLSLAGVSVFQLLRLAQSKKKDSLQVKKEIDDYAKELKIKKELLERSLNEGSSGGEKKKLEVLQAAVLKPKFLIFDEVDTGVDIDALKVIAQFINNYKKDKTYILITHYNRILHHIKPDYVLAMMKGKIIKVSDYRLAEEIERKGYRHLIENI